MFLSIDVEPYYNIDKLFIGRIIVPWPQLFSTYKSDIHFFSPLNRTKENNF